MLASRTQLLVVAAAVALAAGCGGVESESLSPDERHAALVNGAPANLASVGFIAAGQSFRCTATLIGQRTVLTAAHCVTSDVPAVTAAYFVLNNTWTGFNVVGSVIHSGYDADKKVNDLAVLRLDKAPGVTPTPVTTAVPKDGWKVRLYGAGYTGDGANNPGVMRRADNTVAVVGQLRLAYYGNTGAVGNLCFGDSGGPTFALIGGVMAQIGVHSFIRKDCATGEGYDVRLDPFVKWIEATAAGDAEVLDGVDPSASIDSPADGAELDSGRNTIRVSGSDERALSKLEVHVDNKLVGEGTKSPLDLTTDLAAGRHEIRVTAHDSAGNTASAKIVVTVKQPPQPPPPHVTPPPDPQPTSKPLDPSPPDPAPMDPTPTSTPRLLQGGCAVGGAGATAAAPPPLPLLAVIGLLVLAGRRRRRRQRRRQRRRGRTL